MKHLIAALVLIISLPLMAVGVDQTQLSDPALEAEARAQFKNYRCLVCQNQSIEDSDAELAADLRAIIREQVEAGKNPEEIKTFLLARYGDWVLLRPRASGFTLLLWSFPVFLLIGGLGIAFRMRRKVARPDEKAADEAIQTSDEELLRQFRDSNK